jgi:hypothetical protein
MAAMHTSRVAISLDREVDSRRGGDTHRNQHQQCPEPHFELKLNKEFKSVVVCLKGASLSLNVKRNLRLKLELNGTWSYRWGRKFLRATCPYIVLQHKQIPLSRNAILFSV